ncbi:MAG TPA: metallophosphoesterase family protein [Actinomycetota bacterium]|nr:metallophosphoesterase family protein [Actinomycetota bacterium]
MRIAVLADIHGNLVALEAVLADLEKQSPDQIWCAGDLGWLGPRAAECISVVREAGWPTVKGNTDVWITGDPQTIEDEAERSRVVEIAEAHAISPDDARWLISLPVGHPGPGSLLMVHGTPDTPFRAPLPGDPPASFAPYAGKAGLVVFGHVHVPFMRRLEEGTVVVNPGSVGLPLQGRLAQYMVIDQHGPQWTIQHRQVIFDVDSVVEQANGLGGLAAERFLGYLLG